MTKELLTIEFRYLEMPKNEAWTEHRNKTITIGVFDTLEEAILRGNEMLTELSKSFEIRPEDRFKLKHLFGTPCRLVCNVRRKTNIDFYAKIEQLKYDDLSQAVKEVKEATNKYVKWYFAQNED